MTAPQECDVDSIPPNPHNYEFFFGILVLIAALVVVMSMTGCSMIATARDSVEAGLPAGGGAGLGLLFGPIGVFVFGFLGGMLGWLWKRDSAFAEANASLAQAVHDMQETLRTGHPPVPYMEGHNSNPAVSVGGSLSFGGWVVLIVAVLAAVFFVWKHPWVSGPIKSAFYNARSAVRSKIARGA